MISRRAPDTRIVLLLIVVAFLAAVAWWWSLRAGRVEASTAPTPITPTPAATPGMVPAVTSPAR